MIARAVLGAIGGAVLAWVLLVGTGHAGPDSTLLGDAFSAAWATTVGVAKWFAGAADYPQRAAIAGGALLGGLVAANTRK